jgi:hypothetical protein
VIDALTIELIFEMPLHKIFPILAEEIRVHLRSRVRELRLKLHNSVAALPRLSHKRAQLDRVLDLLGRQNGVEQGEQTGCLLDDQTSTDESSRSTPG